VDRDPAQGALEGASKRSVCRDHGIAHKTLQKILANTEPPGYRGVVVNRGATGLVCSLEDPSPVA
jgi:hypothetical protein